MFHTSGAALTLARAGGNVRFNPDTFEIDVNIDMGSSDHTDMQKIAHELKHAYQYLQNKLLLSFDGNGGVNSQQFEREAYNRQNLFANNESGTISDVRTYVWQKYGGLPETNITALPGSGNHSTIMTTAYAFGKGEITQKQDWLVTYGWAEQYRAGKSAR